MYVCMVTLEAAAATVFMCWLWANGEHFPDILRCAIPIVCLNYEGVSKSPRTMLITRKSLVVHEFPARVCCGGVL